MIKNIIFDIGNVLTDFRWRDFLRDQGYDDAVIDRIANASVLSDVWCEYDRGEWTQEQLLDAFVSKDPDIEEEIRMAFSDFTGMVTPREYAIPWVKELKQKGYRVLFLSNFSRKAELECADALSFMPYMDGGILSYQDKVIKPDTAIYELLLSRYELVAQESVFIDDTLVNVEAAIGVGMQGIHFKTKEQVDAELKALGV